MPHLAGGEGSNPHHMSVLCLSSLKTRRAERTPVRQQRLHGDSGQSLSPYHQAVLVSVLVPVLVCALQLCAEL
jgi:hypothetical protein